MLKQTGRSVLAFALPLVPAAALALAAPLPAAAADGQFMSGCELDVFKAGQRLGIEPARTAPGTDGPNALTASERRFAMGQPEILLSDPARTPKAAPPTMDDVASRERELLTRALVAARRGDDFTCQIRVEDALRLGKAATAS
jgi:hypothetical protein